MLNLRAAGRKFQELLRDEYPESYEVLTNEEAFKEFLWGLKKEIKSLNVRTAGIETHQKGWEFVEV